MGYPLEANFKTGQPPSAVPADWYNTVAQILNDLTGVGVQIVKTPMGLGWKIIVETQDHSFKFSMGSDISLDAKGGKFETGAVYLGGTPMDITDWPTGGKISGLTVDRNYWLRIDFKVATVTWEYAEDGDADYPEPELDQDELEYTEIWPIADIYMAGSGDTLRIDRWKQRQWSDIHITRTA